MASMPGNLNSRPLSLKHTMPEPPIAYQAYQELADHYAALIDTKPHNAYYERPAMLGMLPELRGKRVLDALD